MSHQSCPDTAPLQPYAPPSSRSPDQMPRHSEAPLGPDLTSRMTLIVRCSQKQLQLSATVVAKSSVARPATLHISMLHATDGPTIPLVLGCSLPAAPAVGLGVTPPLEQLTLLPLAPCHSQTFVEPRLKMTRPLASALMPQNLLLHPSTSFSLCSCSESPMHECWCLE